MYFKELWLFFRQLNKVNEKEAANEGEARTIEEDAVSSIRKIDLWLPLSIQQVCDLFYQK